MFHEDGFARAFAEAQAEEAVAAEPQLRAENARLREAYYRMCNHNHEVSGENCRLREEVDRLRKALAEARAPYAPALALVSNGGGWTDGLSIVVNPYPVAELATSSPPPS